MHARMSQKTVKNAVEIILFSFIILMLGYAWVVHFYYGVILTRPEEPFEHAVFWSVLYPISIFFLTIFFSKRLGFKRTRVNVALFALFLLISFLSLNTIMWATRFFGYVFWTFLTAILVILVCITSFFELYERIKNKQHARTKKEGRM